MAIQEITLIEAFKLSLQEAHSWSEDAALFYISSVDDSDGDKSGS
ncbi:hypothetical protein [Paenibacillus sp. N3.4]|nr:hypothetical protein [Paenibacillus sp. N3.4]